MTFLHDRRFVHRDLKTMNILLDDSDNVKIADFGLIGIVQEGGELKGGVGTPHYTAPEVLEGKLYGLKVDVYSYGIILWEMATGQIPFRDRTHKDIIDMVLNRNERLPFSLAVTLPMQQLIRNCWSRDPDERPSFKDIIALFEKGGTLFHTANGQPELPVACRVPGRPY
jgi:serine/threonine protein kinase